jgi:hypothetical protein
LPRTRLPLTWTKKENIRIVRFAPQENELLMWLVRHGVTVPAEAAGPISSAVPNDAETAAMASLRATLAAGNPWSNNQLADRFGLTRAQATNVRQRVTTESDGSELEA